MKLLQGKYPPAGGAPCAPCVGSFHSHSIVPGGLLVMS